MCLRLARGGSMSLYEYFFMHGKALIVMFINTMEVEKLITHSYGTGLT